MNLPSRSSSVSSFTLAQISFKLCRDGSDLCVFYSSVTEMHTLRVSIANTLYVFVRRRACGIADHALRAPNTLGAFVLEDVDQLADTLEPETL
jgi:hypothetical protein